MKQRRQVKIELKRDTYFVMYVSRQKFCRHSAAQFDANQTNLDGVIEYIKTRPDLELVKWQQQDEPNRGMKP